MTNARKSSIGTGALCLLVLTTGAAKPPAFSRIDYPGAKSTFAYGINAPGDIVGSYLDLSNHEHGFAQVNGEFSSFDWPGSTWTQAWGINTQGDIVGQYGWLEGGIRTIHGFLLTGGEFYDVDVPGEPNTMPVKISPEGTIVGCYHNGNPNGTVILDSMYGFVADIAGLTTLSLSRTMHTGVNPAGDVVGQYFSLANGRAEESYLIEDGRFTWFHFPGSVVTQAWDINSRGTIVGWHRSAMSGPLQFHGFVMEGGEMTSFDVPGATQTRAFGISAANEIVGYYADGSGIHGFLLSRQR